ncbi:hypothetical protein DFJ74DRAFT_454409 [Hyaloraphidium curvatum]|nr:hypothetical protein DFJ74DRAFT_454409 [Hyaloraphidium curvatum]
MTTGVITTFAGNGGTGVSGDNGAPTSATLETPRRSARCTTTSSPPSPRTQATQRPSWHVTTTTTCWFRQLHPDTGFSSSPSAARLHPCSSGTARTRTLVTTVPRPQRRSPAPRGWPGTRTETPSSHPTSAGWSGSSRLAEPSPLWLATGRRGTGATASRLRTRSRPLETCGALHTTPRVRRLYIADANWRIRMIQFSWS